MLSFRRARVAALAAAAMSFAGATSVAEAAPQEGLINLNLTDNTIQVPVAVAANVCDVDVNVLAQDLRDGDADCTADADSEATRTGNGGPSSGPQRGLVNIDISNNTVQVPVTVAANVCDIEVNLLAQGPLPGGNTTCEALATAVAQD